MNTTPRSWVKGKTIGSPFPDPSEVVAIQGSNGEWICKMLHSINNPRSEANAHLIVKAVNHFGEMVDALNEFVTAYKYRPSHLGNGQAFKSFHRFKAILAKVKEASLSKPARS